MRSRLIISNFAFIFVLFAASKTFALPVNWQLGFQAAASPVMQELAELHNFLLIIITLIVLFVSCLLGYVCFRYRASRNPVPQTFSHNVTIEIIWTIIPVIILLIIAIPSFKALKHAEKISSADMTIKVVGHQWYWHYEYPDQGKFGFDSYMLQDSDLKNGAPRLLEVDNRIVIPVDSTVRFLVTASDVIHSFAIPEFGIKIDAVPGRINETWVKATKTGVYYGQCSELCGINHGFMPIAVDVVSKEEFEHWLKKAKEKFS